MGTRFWLASFVLCSVACSAFGAPTLEVLDVTVPAGAAFSEVDVVVQYTDDSDSGLTALTFDMLWNSDSFDLMSWTAGDGALESGKEVSGNEIEPGHYAFAVFSPLDEDVLGNGPVLVLHFSTSGGSVELLDVSGAKPNPDAPFPPVVEVIVEDIDGSVVREDLPMEGDVEGIVPEEGLTPEEGMVEGDLPTEGEPVEGNIPSEGEPIEGYVPAEGEPEDGETPADGETPTDGEVVEGEVEGQALVEGDVEEGETPEGDTEEGEAPEGDVEDEDGETPGGGSTTISFGCSAA